MLRKSSWTTAILLGAVSSVVFAQNEPVLVEDEFCSWAQQQIANTALEALEARVRVHDSYDAFVESKPTVDPLEVHQYSSNPVDDGSGVDQVISCKMKTAERIQQRWGSSSEQVADNSNARCDVVHQRMLEQLRSSLGVNAAAAAGQFVVDEEELTFMGPLWLSPWPFEPVVTDDAGREHLQSRALYVPFSWWVPMPDRFKGTYYCHLVNPVYLESLFRARL